MNSFLSNAKRSCGEFLSSFKISQSTILHMVLGNNSCDLDSCVSAIVLAWFRSQMKNGNEVYVPVVNIERKQFRTRTEIAYLLDHLNIDSRNIICIDEANVRELSNVGKGFFHLTLVDHHVLLKSIEYLQTYVKEIIDHRPQLIELPSRIKCNISLVGSCSTLVAEEMLKNKAFSVPSVVETLLLATILIDTSNLSVDVGKSTPRDEAVVKQLSGKRTKDELNLLFRSVADAKFSVSGLTTEEIILKDPKWIENSLETIMMSTLHLDVREFFAREDSIDVIRNYCATHNLLAWVALAPVINQFKPIALYCEDDEVREKIIEKLIVSDLLLVKTSDEDHARSDVKFLRMYNCKNTRKQVLPLINEVLQQRSSNLSA
ncbi:exopolyphosphatase PRUNE1-like [Clavelina lepadiformis]|uniref:exopolyphosphatase PRUNE1-like n=1 Tax=Clavelina lepadiformis TaxID=159417 RepID=UPI004042CCF0